MIFKNSFTNSINELTSALTRSSIQKEIETLQTQKLSNEEIKATLIKRGYTNAVVESAMASSANAAANTEEALAEASSTAATGADTVAKNANTAAIYKNIKATLMWLTTTPQGLIALGVAASAAVVGIVAYRNSVDGLIKRNQKLIESNHEVYDSLIEEKNKNANNSKNLEELYNDYITAEKGSKEYYDVVNKIKDLSPELVVGYDNEGNAILANNEKIKEQIQLYKELAEEKRKDAIHEANENIDEETNIYNKLKREREEKQDKYVSAKSNLDRLEEQYSINPNADFYNVLVAQRELVSRLGEEIESLDKEMDSSEESLRGYYTSFLPLEDEVTESQKRIREGIIETALASEKALTETDITNMYTQLNSGRVKEAADQIVNLDKNLTKDDYLRSATAIYNELASAFELTDEQKQAFKVAFGIDEGSVGDHNDTIASVSTKLNEMFGTDHRANWRNWFNTQGIDTSAEYQEFLELARGCDTATEAMNKWVETHKKAANETNSVLSFVDVQSNIQNLSKGLDQLDSIYTDILDKEDFDYSSILNNTEFDAQFGKFDEYDEFIETVSNSPNDINACQAAFDKLVTAYIKGTDALKGVTEETKNASVAQLEQMGIINAEEIVDYYIAKEKAAQLGVDFATATADDILMLINEGIVAGETAQALLNYQLQKALANSNSLSTAEDCRQMYELAVKCGATSEVLQDLIKLRQIYETLADSSLGLTQSDMNQLLADANALQSSIKKQVEGFESSYEPVATYTRGLKSAKDASDAAKDATDALKEAIQQEIDALEKQKEALQDSLNELDELYDAIQWVLDGKIEDIDDIIEKIQEENDALAEQREIYDNILSVVDSVYNAEIEAIQEKIDALEKENDEKEKAIALEEARRKVEEMRNNKTILQYTEDNGYVYVRDEAALKEAEDDFAEKSKELEESKIKKELKDQKELLQQNRDLWGEIPDAYEKAMNEMSAIQYFGPDWKNAILNSDESTIQKFKDNYTGIQKDVDKNDEQITFYESEKQKYKDLKELWEDAKNAYRDMQYEAKLASFFGSDYEYQILNNSLTWRTRFTDEYCSLQMQIADIEEKIKALNEQSANIIADSANKVSTALNKTTEAVNGLKSSLSTEGSGGSNILSGVEASVDKSLLQIESLKIALSDLDLARKTLEETIDAEIIDTSKLVGETQTKVQEISIAISSLLLSIRLLRINIEELLTALLNINDTVTLDRVISLIGSGAEGSLLGAINSVIEKLSDANGGLLYELNQLNGKQLDFIIAEFNGDEGLLSAIKEVSSAILSAEDSECLVAKINSLTETIDSINTVKDSFELLETKVGNCVDKVTTLNEKIQGLQDKTITITVEVARHTTFTVDTAIGTEDIPAGIEIDNTELDDILATMPHGYAKGGIVGKKDESILDPYAESLGENHMVAVQNEEAIIPVNTVKANPELVSALLDADGKAINLSDKGISYKIAADSFNKNGNTFIPVDIPNLFGSAISGFNLDKVAPKYENKMNPESYVNTVSNENSVSITIGDIHLSGVQDVNNLSNQIINRLPNLLIQGIGRK